MLVLQEYLVAEEDYRVMRFEMRGVGRIPADYAAPKLSLLTQLNEMLNMGRIVPYPGMPPRDIERMRLANANFGWANLHLNYAIALGLNMQPEEAARQLVNLRAIYGQESYAQAAEIFSKLQHEKYPELATVVLP